MGRTFKRFFSLLVAAPLFVSLTWFFGIYMQPQGSTGAGFAGILIFISAIASIIVYSWLMRPGPKVRFRNRGVEGFDKDWGIGLTGLSQKQGRRRRDDDADPDDMGGRRSSGDVDDADGLGEEGLVG